MAEVGSHSIEVTKTSLTILASLWFPVREGNFTVSFGSDPDLAVSFSREFLKESFAFFQGALDSPMMESSKGKMHLETVEGPSFSLIVAFLVVGSFPKLPGWTACQGALHLTNCLGAMVAADFLQMNKRTRFLDFLKLEVRHVLIQHRNALRQEHIDMVFLANSTPVLMPFLAILAAAGVRPFICYGLKNATKQTINSSGAAKEMGISADKFKEILNHYDVLFQRAGYFLEVVKSAYRVMETSKRLNSISTDSPANKHLRNLPEEIGHVTYQDPLTNALGMNSIFTA